MFALLAFVTFLLGLIFKATSTDTGDVDMVLLGLALLALHFVWTIVLPFPGYRRDVYRRDVP